MKLSNFALLLTAGLLAFTAYLSLQSRRSTNERIDALENKLVENKQQSDEVRAQEAAEWEARLKEEMRVNAEQAKKNQLLADSLKEKQEEVERVKDEADIVVETAEAKVAAAEPSTADLTPQQIKIKEAASIAEVTDFKEEYGFVVLNRGTKNGLAPGMKFAVRRNHFIVGRVEVDSVQEDESIANVATGSVPIGFTIKKGDAVIMGEDAGIY